MAPSFYRNVAVRPLPIGLPGFPDQPPPWGIVLHDDTCSTKG